MFRINHATLSIDGASAEREIRQLLAGLPCGKSWGKGLYLDFYLGRLELCGGIRGFVDLTKRLVTVKEAAIHDNSITFALQSHSLPFFDEGLLQLRNRLPPFVEVRTGHAPALIINLLSLSNHLSLPGDLSLALHRVAFVPGAMIVTLGTCSFNKRLATT